MKSKIISTTTIYKGKSIEVVNQKTVLSDDLSVLTFEFIKRQNVALIIPVLENQELIIIKQYRAAVDSIVLEFPAGKQMDNETIEQTAVRELEEETGYLASKIILIGEFYTAPHFSNEKIYVYQATGLSFQNERIYTDHEFILTNPLPLVLLEQAFEEESIKDAKSIISLQLYKSFING